MKLRETRGEIRSRASRRRPPPVLRRGAAATRRVEAAAEQGGTRGAEPPASRAGRLSGMDVVPLLESLVRAPSPSGEEGPAADVLEAWLRERGLAPVRDGRNVWAAIGDGGPTVLLCSHLDTVPVGDGWTRPALEAARDGTRIYGRGANDAKASVSAM